MHMSMFYRKGPMPISPESHQSIENNEKCTVFDNVTHHDDSRSPAPSLRWQRLVSGVQLAYGWGYHYLELEGKQFRYGGLGMHWTKINTYIRT